MVSPILEELQKEYGGKIQVYKINTDNEHEVANAFGIQSLPTLIFIPVEGKPQGVLGAQPKEEINKMILTVLKVTK
jgi:thioredoxin-like negative regulator of GroEL